MKICNHHPFFMLYGLLFQLVFFSSPPCASAMESTEVTQFDQQVIQQKEKIERVQSGISSHQTKVAASKAEEANLLAELDRIEQQIRVENEKLLSLQTEMARQQALTILREEEMEKINQEKDTLRRHMEKRLNAYYRMGNIGLMNALFSASSLADLVSFKEDYRLMLQYDHQVTLDFKKKIHELENAKKAHQEEKIRLAQAADKVMQQQEVLGQTQQERQKLLERVKTEKQLYQQALAELEKAAEQLTSTLTELKEKATEAKKEKERQFIRDYPLKPFKKRKPSSARGFAAQKGKLPLPVAGIIMKGYWADARARHGSSPSTNGINIESPPGSDIIAVYAGKVVYAGTLPTYGNIIIMDHGKRFYTLVSGIGEILKNVGEKVKQGDKIGITSLHTGALKEGLHFEIRYNTEPLDPLEWLEPSQLSFKK